MRMPTTLTSEQWCKHVLLLAILVATSSRTMAFLPASPVTTRNALTTTTTSFNSVNSVTPSSSLTSRRRQRRRPFHHTQLHLIMADTPIDEDEKINRHNHNDRDRHNDSDDDETSNSASADWIPAANGGFLPNLGNLLGRNKQVTATTTTTKPSSLRNILTVNNLLEYKRHVVDETDRLVCVRFYAPWCRACKAVAPMFARLASQYPSVKFVQVPLTQDNAFMLQGLGVPSLPYGHIYHPQAGLVEERKMNKKVFGTLAYVLSTYVHGECVLEEYEKLLLKEDKSGIDGSDDHDTILKP